MPIYYFLGIFFHWTNILAKPEQGFTAIFFKNRRSLVKGQCHEMNNFLHFLEALDINKKLGGSERWLWLGFSLGLWRSMAICHLNMQFLCKKHISVSLATAKLIGDVWMTMQSGVKMFFSAITASIYWCI
jgi:hypothetical protein